MIILIGVIYRENDVEEKIVVAPKIYTSEQITAPVKFQERWLVSWLAAVYKYKFKLSKV